MYQGMHKGMHKEGMHRGDPNWPALFWPGPLNVKPSGSVAARPKPPPDFKKSHSGGVIRAVMLEGFGPVFAARTTGHLPPPPPPPAPPPPLFEDLAAAAAAAARCPRPPPRLPRVDDFGLPPPGDNPRWSGPS